MQVPRNQDELLEQLLDLARLGPRRVILHLLNDDIAALDLEMLLLARRRVRQAQGLAEDGYDALAHEVQQRAG
jgi:hypothetical protein